MPRYTDDIIVNSVPAGSHFRARRNQGAGADISSTVLLHEMTPYRPGLIFGHSAIRVLKPPYSIPAGSHFRTRRYQGARADISSTVLLHEMTPHPPGLIFGPGAIRVQEPPYSPNTISKHQCQNAPVICPEYTRNNPSRIMRFVFP